MIHYALMGALLIVVQVALAAIPNIELVSLLILVYARKLGWRALYPVYVFVGAEILIYGLGLWTINYLYVWIVPIIAARLFRAQSAPLFWAVISGVYGLLFGALCALPYFLIGGPSAALAYWLSGIPFDLIHCAGNAAVALFLVQPAMKGMEYVMRGSA